MAELAFYSKFARPLILSLPDHKNRVLAASWLKKIRNEESGPETLRTNYLKLLLFALQRQKLVGIFEDDPTSYDKLEDFTEEYDLNTLAKLLIEKEHKDRQDRITAQLKGEIGDFPPYTTDYSSDFKEYVAAQDIPGFGVHCFYALSKEPISNWKKVEKAVIPKFAKSAVDTMSPVPHGVSKMASDSACVCAPKDDPSGDPSECRTRNKPSEPQRKKKSKQLGRSPPTHPLGKPPPPEDRQVPQWGSNLTEIKNLIQFDEEQDKSPKKSTGAVPKVKGKGVKIVYDDDSSVQEIDQALSDFRKGDISGIQRRKGKSPTTEEHTEGPPDVGSPYQSVAGCLIPRDEYEDWRNREQDRSIWQEEVEQDSGVINYFKQQQTSRDAKRHLSHLHEKSHTSEPAKARLPLTTPKLSPSPKRVISSDKLIDEDRLPALKRPCKTPDQVDPRKDQELSRLHEDLLAGIAEDEDRLRREQEELEMRETQEREALRRVQLAKDATTKRHHSKKKEQAHIQPGSPEANVIFAEYLDNVAKATKEEYSEDEEEGGPAIFEAQPMDSSYEADYESTPSPARLVVREPNPSELMHIMPDVKHVAEDKYIDKTVAGVESQKFAKPISELTETPKLGRLPKTDEAMEKKKRRKRTTEQTIKRRLDFDDGAPEVAIMDQPVPAYLGEPLRQPRRRKRYTHPDSYSYHTPPPVEHKCYSDEGSYHTPERVHRQLGPPGSYSSPDTFEREDIEDERYLKEMSETLHGMEIEGDWRVRRRRRGPQMSPVLERHDDSTPGCYCNSSSGHGSPGYSSMDSVEREDFEDARHMEDMRQVLENIESLEFSARPGRPGPQMSPIYEQPHHFPAESHCYSSSAYQSPGYISPDSLEREDNQDARNMVIMREHHTGSSNDHTPDSLEGCGCNDQYSDKEYHHSSHQSPSRVVNRTYTKQKFVTNRQ